VLKQAKATCPVLRFSEHLSGVDGAALLRHACALGLEGIVSKRLMSRYKSGASAAPLYRPMCAETQVQSTFASRWCSLAHQGATLFG
jgi:hypothetical protein